MPSPTSDRSAETDPPPWFQAPGDAVLLLGDPGDLANLDHPSQALPNSGLHPSSAPQEPSPATAPDPTLHATLRTTLRGLILAGGIKSVNACGPGGLAVTLASACLRGPSPQGASFDLRPRLPATAPNAPASSSPPAPEPANSPSPQPTVPWLDALLFAESPALVVTSCAPLDTTKIVERTKLLGVPARRIGTVGGDVLRFHLRTGEFEVPLAELARWTNPSPEPG